jgi:hypothetical protein
LYAEIQALDDPQFAWRLWRRARDELFRSHPQSPLERHRPVDFAGLALRRGPPWPDWSVKPPANRAPLRSPALFGENGVRRR